MASTDIFLSYRREDAPFVDDVRNAVRSAGYSAVDTPPEAIRNAAFLIACISANGYVSDELDAAIEEVRSGARDPSWLMVMRLGECSIPPLPVTGFTTLPELVVRLGDLESRLGRPPAVGIDVDIEADDVMAPDIVVSALQADGEAIIGQTIRSKTKVRNVVADRRAAVIGTVITTKRSRKP
jgi:hypothetical protein